jgi:serine/threonine-protein kinase
MGRVVRARDPKLDREVAVKLLAHNALGDSKARERMLREARAVAKLEHPHIIHVYDVGETDDGGAFIVMELVRGQSLRARLQKEPLTLAEAIRVFADCARALAFAHAHGIVHRDVKPDNIMLREDGRPVILDFGIVKSASAEGPSTLTEHGAIVGTPAYLAPEQARGEVVDGRTDQFALAVTLFEALTCRLPWSGHSVPEVVASMLRDAPAPIEGVPLAREVARVIERALRKPPQDRYGDMARFADALEALLPELAAAGSTPSPLAKTQATPLSLAETENAVAPATPATPAKPESPARTPAEGARPTRSRAVFLALGGLAVVAGTVALWPRCGASQPTGATSAAASSRVSAAPASGAALPGVTRIVDLPAPKTSVPEAAAEYVAGLQAIYDNTWFIGADHLLKAVALDPGMPEAHLRLSLVMLTMLDPDMRSAEFEKAAGLRTRLTDRDQALMTAVQPYLQPQVQDVREADKRLHALEERYPKDTEILMWHSVVHYFTPAALPIVERALALDPRDPVEWEVKADALVVQGRLEEGLAAYDTCGQFSIDGAECHAIKGWSERGADRCEDSLGDFNKAVDRNPFWLNAAVNLMASTGATTQLLEETTKKGVAALPPVFGPEANRLGYEARLAILAGDFPRAEAATKKEAAALDADPLVHSLYWLRLMVATQRLDVALETGDAAAVQRIAKDFVARSEAWPKESFLELGIDVFLTVARLAYPATEPPPPSFEALRRKWIEDKLAAGAYPGVVWSYGWASPALTPAEAKSAIDALAELGPPSTLLSIGGITFSGRAGSPEAAAGRVYLLAGKVDDAIPHLKRGAVACDLFDSTIDHLRASLDLGRALELKGDRAGACDAYAKVLAIWGHAKPRSVTANAARERATALGCAAR